MTPLTVFITGANRGLGFEFTRQYLAQGARVIATCRQPDTATQLTALLGQYPNQLIIIRLNVTSRTSQEQALHTLLHELSPPLSHIDLLINNAGIISGGPQRDYPLGQLHQEDMEHVFLTNTIAPLLVTETFLPLLENATEPKLAFISSVMGSITSKQNSQNYSYSASKAALNMMGKMLALDLHSRKVTVFIFHPGWAQTDMGGPAATLTPSESIHGLVHVIQNHGLSDSGKFWDYQGQELPW